MKTGDDRSNVLQVVWLFVINPSQHSPSGLTFSDSAVEKNNNPNCKLVLKLKPTVHPSNTYLEKCFLLCLTVQERSHLEVLCKENSVFPTAAEHSKEPEGVPAAAHGAPVLPGG